MKINRSKTFTTLFTLSTKVKPVKIMLNHTELQHIDSATYLGVTFDRRQTWKPHICNAETKARRKLAPLRKLAGTQWGAAEAVLKNVYIGTIRPHLDYGSTTCSSASKTSNYTLDKVQNQALRLITGSMRSTPIQIMEEITAIQPLSKRRDMRIMIQAERHKCSPSHPMKTKIRGMTKNELNVKASYTRPTHFQRFTKAVVTQCNQHILLHRRAKIQPDQLISELQYLPSQETKMTHRRNYSHSPT